MSAQPVSNHTEEREENIHTRARAWVNETSSDARDIFEKLVAASGDALDQTRLNLHAIKEPLQWINAGADLDQDILPTIRAKSARMGAGQIKSWGFFEGAVMDALATRNRVDKRGAEIRAAVKSRTQRPQQEPDTNEYAVKPAGDPYAFH